MSEQQINKTAEEKSYEKIGELAAMGSFAESWVDRLFRPLFRQLEDKNAGWAKNAELTAELEKLPRARLLLYGVILTFIALIAWAAVAEIDQVSRGEGKVIPSKKLQVVQSMDGGVVEEIAVFEGQLIKKGDLIVRIDPTRFVASFAESQAKSKSLQAKVARLNALVKGEEYQPAITEDLTAEEVQMLEQEVVYFHSSKAELRERLSIAEEQLSQRKKELNETQARLSQAERNYQMLSHELELTKPLLTRGAVSEVELLRVERDVSQAKGEKEQATARLEVSKAAVVEAQARLREEGHSIRNQWRGQLSDARAELNSLNQGIGGLADRVKTTAIRSPVDGTVQRVMFNTVGGVVQPGNTVAEIVPADDKLLIEAKIRPADIAFLHPNLPAIVKFHAYDFTVYGGMEAELTHISADTITDEKDNTFYLVRASTDRANLRDDLPIIPGMTVQLDILTGKKTILAYILKPLLRARENSLGER